MNLWIKICGLTTSDAVDAAVAAGADAIGFVFAPSKRRVTAERALQLARGAPSSIKRVAVMLHPSQAEVDEVCSVFKPDLLQTDFEDFRSVEISQPPQPLPVFRNGYLLEGALPARLLFEGAHSGTGKTANWSQAAVLAKRTQLVLAGGLNAGNVSDAIVSVAPFGVDVSSGVEWQPGIKDPQLIHEFVRAARAAARKVGGLNAS